MNKLFPVYFFFLVSIATLAQPKPQKTFDHVAFGKKVYGNFSAGMSQSIFLPDDKALAFISAKTGTSIDQLKQGREANKEYISTDKVTLQGENCGGLMISKVDLVKVDHPTLTMGNIIIQVGAGPGMKRIEFGNCIQTDVTWVLGDYMALEGNKPVRVKPETKEETIAKYLSKKDKDYSQIKNKIWSVLEVIIISPENPNGIYRAGAQLAREGLYNFDVKLFEDGKSQGYLNKGSNISKEWNSQYEIKEDQLVFLNKGEVLAKLDFQSCSKDEFIVKGNFDNNIYYFIASATPEIVKPEVSAVGEQKLNTANSNKQGAKRVGYHASPFPQSGANEASQFIQFDQIGLPLAGYYINQNDEKVNAVIAYQEPEKLLLHPFNLAICKEANGKKVDYLNPDSEPNFVKYIPKDQVKAFFVGGQLFVQSTPGRWHILIDEGAIRKLVDLAKVTKGTQTGYMVGYLNQKLTGSPENQQSMMLSFKNTMSGLVGENAELALKIKNKEPGYQFMQIDKIVAEYNQWFDQQFPRKVPYLPL